MSETIPPPQPTDFYAVFCDEINQASVNRLTRTFQVAMQNGCQHIHLLFQSTGGTVNDGLFLFEYFRALPISFLTLYNVWGVCSIAVVAYLGAAHRVTTPTAMFMIH